jgi:hypothetical protein
MGLNQNQNRGIIQRSGGFFQDLTNRFRLIGRLLMDSRVSPLLKVLPVGTLIYLVSPVDLLSLNPVDDAFIVWAGTTLFVELCPPQIVDEHLRILNRVVPGQWQDIASSTPPTTAPTEEIVEGEFFETDPKEPKGPKI